MAGGGYAIIGWGSLIWDLENLTPHVRLPWAMSGGPRLPMEFCRISPKRKMSLVVILDPEHGADCPTHAVTSVRDTVAGAAADLARRERAPAERIGAVCLETGLMRGSHPEIAARIRAWCVETGRRGAVWTDLPANFAEETGRRFSLAAARAYLETLTDDSLAEAVRYIDSAPETTDTPLRRLLANDPWWRELRRRHGGAGRD